MKGRRSLYLIIALIALSIAVALSLWFFRGQPQQSTSRATGEAICPADGGSCSFEYDGTDGASFKVEIIDEATGASVVTKTTTDKSVQFTPVVGHTYKCTVTAVNSCSSGEPQSTTNTCIAQVTDTPTPSPTKTPTSTPSITNTPTPTPVGCSACGESNPYLCTDNTTSETTCNASSTMEGHSCILCFAPTDTPTPTPTQTPTETPSPFPTATPSPTNTPTTTPTTTPTKTPTPTTTGTPAPTNTPYPTNTLYPTNSPYPTSSGYPTPTPTEIIIVVNNTNTPTPTQAGTAAPTIPSAGVPVAWFIILIPVALVTLGLLF